MNGLPQTVKKLVGKGNPADEAFKALKIDTSVDNVIRVVTSSQFSKWIQYVDDFNKKNPSKQLSFYSTLVKHYDNAALVKLIEQAKLAPSTQAIGKRLQAEQLRVWLRKGRSPDDIFDILLKTKMHDDLLTTPTGSLWVTYVDDFNKFTLTRR